MHFTAFKTRPLFFTGLNLQSQFNLENVTVFNTNEHESTLGQKVKTPMLFCSKCVRQFAQQCAAMLSIQSCVLIIQLSFQVELLILELGSLPGI